MGKQLCDKCGKRKRNKIKVAGEASNMIFGNRKEQWICRDCLEKAERTAKILGVDLQEWIKFEKFTKTFRIGQ